MFKTVPDAFSPRPVARKRRRFLPVFRAKTGPFRWICPSQRAELDYNTRFVGIVARRPISGDARPAASVAAKMPRSRRSHQPDCSEASRGK